MLFQLSKNTDQNTQTLSLAYESKDKGERFAEHEYKLKLIDKTREHKE